MHRLFTVCAILLSGFVNIAVCQNITLRPVQGEMTCAVLVPALGRQSFALGLPETIGSSEGMILNFPETDIQWEGPDGSGAVSCNWVSDGRVEYALRVTPSDDYVDAEMMIRNLGRTNWTNVFSFNCLNPVAAPHFQDWNLERTFMSRNGRPYRMDSTTRVNNGTMSTVQFYLNEHYADVSPFVKGFKATSPDQTDDSYIVTLSDDGTSFIAATSPDALFLFDNLDRCCIHSAVDFGDIPAGEERTVACRFYFARGGLQDFLLRFNSEIRGHGVSTRPRVLMCYGNPWALADTTQWRETLQGIDILKFYIGNIGTRMDPDSARDFIGALLAHDVKIAVELGGLLDWHASKGDRAAEASFQQEFAGVQPLIHLIRSIDPQRTIDMLDLDGPIRRMLFPNNASEDYHTLQSAVDELFQVVQLWRDSIPGIEINLLTNFPNWAWGSTPAYYKIDGHTDGYGQYMDVLAAVRAKSLNTGTHLDGLTVDNPYDYAIGVAQSNQPTLIAGVDWMQRVKEVQAEARDMGLKLNMIFNTNGGRTAQGYSEQTVAFVDLYRDRIGAPDGYWIQSWYQLPGAWLPEQQSYTMTHLTREVLRMLDGQQPDTARAFLEPADGHVYHGMQTLTFGRESVDGYLSVLDETTQPAVRGLFFSIPGTRGAAQSLKRLAEFYAEADSIGFIPELSLFLTDGESTDSIIAVSDTYDSIIDSIVTLSKNYGRRMFLRIGGEFNGAWNGYHQYLYVKMYQKIVDRFTAAGMRDSIATIWCYMPAAGTDFDSVDVRGPLWYPGDDYVDWFGLDVFDAANFDQSLPDNDRRGITTKGKSEMFLALARAKRKPVFMSETSAIHIEITADEADGRVDWEAWFAKFWEFIAAHKEIKGFSYINTEWPEHAYPGWGDSRINLNSYISAMYQQEMKNLKYIHLPINATSAVDRTVAMPGSIILEQNSPNPFNPSTRIRFVLPRPMTVSLVVTDALGREVVRLLDNESRTSGQHQVQFRADRISSGVYLYRLETGDEVLVKKMVLVR